MIPPAPHGRLWRLREPQPRAHHVPAAVAGAPAALPLPSCSPESTALLQSFTTRFKDWKIQVSLCFKIISSSALRTNFKCILSG